MTDVQTSKIDRDDTALLLGVLSVVDEDARVTQRGLSSQLGIALGLANAVLRRCVRKGLIKISNAPLNRYAYYLTPSGFAEKSRLTVEYLRFSFDLFRDARRQYSELFATLRERGRSRLVLVGVSELAEAATLSAREVGIDVVGLADPARAGENFLGLLVAASLRDFAGRADALAICDMRNPLASYEAALESAPTMKLERNDVVAPELLRLSRRAALRTVETA
ncbi:MAG: winged helix-turn-helix transcriptional regulator [Alphaproteobacteria bacterium]|nr:winged helix-turn-helix transcriptional regulator [Alphaproteobacteria bacterium]